MDWLSTIPQVKFLLSDRSKSFQQSKIGRLVRHQSRRPANETLRSTRRDPTKTCSRAMKPQVLTRAGAAVAKGALNWQTNVWCVSGMRGIPSTKNGNSMTIKHTNPTLHHFDSRSRVRTDSSIDPTRLNMRRPTTGTPSLPKDMRRSARIPIEGMVRGIQRQSTKQRGTTPKPSRNLNQTDGRHEIT